MFKSSDPKSPPSKLLLMLEVRGIWEMHAFFASYTLLRRSPRGDGHPVLVLPGLSAGDRSTTLLRAYLTDMGYAVHGWEQGKNRGPRPGVEAGIDARIVDLHRRYGRKVSLIGWSLGGVFAREAARRAPHLTRQVISLGSPFANEPKASNAWRLYEALSGRSAEDWPNRAEMKIAPATPCTAIYSRTDGVVAWQGCRELPGPTTQNVEVEGSHCGLGHNPLALYVIADRLALPEHEWRPFDRSSGYGVLYPDPYREEYRVA